MEPPVHPEGVMQIPIDISIRASTKLQLYIATCQPGRWQNMRYMFKTFVPYSLFHDEDSSTVGKNLGMMYGNLFEQFVPAFWAKYECSRLHVYFMYLLYEEWHDYHVRSSSSDRMLKFEGNPLSRNRGDEIGIVTWY